MIAGRGGGCLGLGGLWLLWRGQGCGLLEGSWSLGSGMEMEGGGDGG